MSRELEFSAASAVLLEPYLPPAGSPPPPSPSSSPSSPAPSTRPFVTLTYAQSLDASIALAPGVRTRLSGPESKAMTHYLRSRHDAILVGVSTVLADDPALNCRIAGSSLSSQPRPIVVDPHLRWTPARDDKVLQTCRAGAGLAPYVLTAVGADRLPPASVDLLREHGGKFITVPAESGPWPELPGPEPIPGHGPISASASSSPSSSANSARFDWRRVFAALCAEGLASVMVEGGGHVINSLLEDEARRPGLVDSVIVTIAPTWLGQGGVVVSPRQADQGRTESDGEALPAARLSCVRWHPFGEDIVLCGKLLE